MPPPQSPPVSQDGGKAPGIRQRPALVFVGRPGSNSRLRGKPSAKVFLTWFTAPRNEAVGTLTI
jgi:hypothetical protein